MLQMKRVSHYYGLPYLNIGFCENTAQITDWTLQLRFFRLLMVTALPKLWENTFSFS